MPNWSEGSLKLRGKKENIIRFLNDLEPCKDQSKWSYIPDSDRAFIVPDPYYVTENIEMLNDYDTLEPAVITIHLCQAWGINTDDFVNISNRYNLDIRINAVERGMMFSECYEIINGQVTKSEAKDYKSSNDFEWNVPFSYLGG